ncbi:jg5163 [Pararge aegeria aegeria]|uniref:Jg5163 protein n=1 Tax=Pararge aegeria aegeria TaxID=348720 RepID=A0A8S4SA51_9NEOP|nr:jg5163 [Pararge aegeria aegeria]
MDVFLPECRTGEVVVTSGFDLRCRHIIHTVCPKYVAKYHTAAESSLHNCYKNVLHAAREAGAKSLALCLVSAPRKNFPPDVAAHVALRKSIGPLSLHYYLFTFFK